MEKEVTMIHFNIGDVIKSTTYDWLDGAKIIKIKGKLLYFILKDNKTPENLHKEAITHEIERGGITHIPGKILNWKERIR